MSVILRNPANDVVIRYIETDCLPTPDQQQTWHSWFDASEKARMQRFQKSQHRQRFLLSHALLRGALAEFADCLPTELQFGTQPQGKPLLISPSTTSELHFNLSHTHGMAAIAISQRPVGLDIEWLQRRGPEVALAQRYFTDREYQDILSQPLAQQHRRLLSYWTLKEAYIKAEGWGLSIGLDSFEFTIDDNSPPQLRVLHPSAQSHQPWQFQQFELGSSHLVALAAVPQTKTNTTKLNISCVAWPG